MTTEAIKPYSKLIWVASIIGALSGIYKGGQFFLGEYENHINKHIERTLVIHEKEAQAKLDAALKEINYYIEMDTKRDNILVNVVLAETEPKKFGVFRFYKTNPNEDGHAHIWHKTKERKLHTIIYEATYNPTEMCYGYLDRFNKYYLLKQPSTGEMINNILNH